MAVITIGKTTIYRLGDLYVAKRGKDKAEGRGKSPLEALVNLPEYEEVQECL